MLPNHMQPAASGVRGRRRRLTPPTRSAEVVKGITLSAEIHVTFLCKWFQTRRPGMHFALSAAASFLIIFVDTEEFPYKQSIRILRRLSWIWGYTRRRQNAKDSTEYLVRMPKGSDGCRTGTAWKHSKEAFIANRADHLEN